MAESLPLSLQAFPPPDEEKESLQYLIQRINAQKGSFRNVTEHSLQEEIRNSEVISGGNDEVDVVGAVQAPIDASATKEEVIKAREEILKQIGQALGDTSTALEFLSLLLSKNSSAAQTTISPFLKQAVPLGTLDASAIEAPQITELEKHNEELLGIGWRMQSLNGAADSLLKSASRLEEEMERETRYWEQVLAIKEKGWSIHRLPREKHTLGVRYGFGEAQAGFREKGLAALRRDENGTLRLDRGVTNGDRRLRVRILENGKPIASTAGDAINMERDGSVEEEIVRARDSIFDEELHHELDREARNLVNQGVRCNEGSILLPYESAKQIEISLMARDEEHSDEVGKDDIFPEAIVTSFRILLSYAHRQNLRNRSQVPPPLREVKASRPVYALIKPVLEYLQHESCVNETQGLLGGLTNTLKAAGVSFSLDQPASSHNLRLWSKTRGQSDSSAIDDLLRLLTSPQHTSLTMICLNESITITIEIHTALQPPHFGTTFHVAVRGSASEQKPTALVQPEQFTTSNTFQAHVLHVFTLIIQQTLLPHLAEWRTVSNHSHSIVRARPRPQSKDTVFIELSKDTVFIELSKERLDLTWQSTPSGQHATWTWHADGHGENKSIIEMLKRL